MFTHAAGLGASGVVMAYTLIPVLLASFAGLSMSGLDMGKLQQLNQELGRLCSSSPPEQAQRVCQIHARLVNGA